MALEVNGQCPIQGYAHVRGRLVYFRARGSWSIRVWEPGEFEVTGRGADADVSAVVRRNDSVWDDAVRLTEPDADADPTFPEQAPYSEDYPGWWTHEYALRVFEWAVAKVIPQDEGTAP